MFKNVASSIITHTSSVQDPNAVDGAPESDASLATQNSKAAAMLMAYLAFKQPDKKRVNYLIPKDKAAWLEYLVHLVKRKTTIEYLSDKELKKVIIRSRPNLGGKKPVYQNDPDAPICMNWSVEQTGEWIAEAGFSYLQEGFQMNRISGRRLITIDCSALNRMGMTDLTEMQKVTAKIRELLQIPKPNMIRALMRIPPFESYLRQKILVGKSYDMLTFEKYCKQEGYNYVLLKNNKNALIPCTCEVRIVPNGIVDEDEEEQVESEEEDLSLKNAPTVEYIVRNVVVRDKTVASLIEDIMESVFSPPDSRKYGKPILDSFRDALGRAYDDIGGMTSQERLEFATTVADALLEELKRTTEILNDIQELQKYIKEKVPAEKVKHLQECAEEFMENVMPIASLLALGELDLETIFKQEPEFEALIDEVCEDAEATINALVPDALEFVESVIKLAQKKVKDMHLPGLSDESVSSAKSLIFGALNETMDDALHIATSALSNAEPEPSEPGFHQSVQVDFPDPDDEEEIRKEFLKQEAVAAALNQKTLTEVGSMHLGEGQKQHTVAHTEEQLDKPHHQPRTHLTLSRGSSVASRSGQASPNPSHSGRSHPVSAASILSKHSEQGDQPLHPADKREDKERQERLKAIRSMVRLEKEERDKKRTVKGAGKLNLEDGKILDFNGKVVGIAGKNFTVLAEDGKTVIGFVDKTGTAYTDEGTMLGKFDLGKKKAPSVLDLVTVGKKAKKIVGSDGRLLGSVELDGRVLNTKGEVLGNMESNGIVIQVNGKLLNIHGDILGDDGLPFAKLRSGLAVIPDWKGSEITPGEEVWKKVLGGEAKFLIGTNGIVVGEITRDGKILAKDGNALGEILPGGLIVMRDGKPLQIQAKIVGDKGDLICTVVQGVTKVPKKRQEDPSSLSRSMSMTNSQLLAAIEESDEAENKLGKEILMNYHNKQAVQKDTTRNPQEPDIKHGTEKARNDGAITKDRESQDEKSFPPPFTQNEIWDKVLIGQAKFLIGTNGVPIGEIGNDGRIMAKDGTAVGKMLPNGLVVMNDGKPLQTQAKIVDILGEMICLIDEGVMKVHKKPSFSLAQSEVWNKVLLGDAKFLTGTNGVSLGEIGKDGQIMGKYGYVIGKMLPNGLIVMNDGKPLQTQAKLVDILGDMICLVEDGIIKVPKLSSTTFTQSQVWNKVILGEAKFLIGTDGVRMGEFGNDGRIMDKDGRAIGKMLPNGLIMMTDGKPLQTQAKLVDILGEMICLVDEGITKVHKRPSITQSEVWNKVILGEAKFLVGTSGVPIGEIESDGRIMTKDGTVFGKMLPNGLIVMTDGKPLQTQAKLVDILGEMICLVDDGITKVQKRPSASLSQSNLWDKVLEGEAKFLVGTNGVDVWGIGKDGRIKAQNGTIVGKILPNGLILMNDGKPLQISANILNISGEMICAVEEGVTKIPKTATSVALTTSKVLKNVLMGETKYLIGTDGVVVGEIQNDGKILSGDGTSIGKVLPNGLVVMNDGKPLQTAADIVDSSGEKIGTVEKGFTRAPKNQNDKPVPSRVPSAAMTSGQLLAAMEEMEDGRAKQFEKEITMHTEVNTFKDIISNYQKSQSSQKDRNLRPDDSDLNVEDEMSADRVPRGTMHSIRNPEEEKERKRIAQQKLEKLQEDWEHQETEDIERRKKLKLEQDEAERKAKRSRLRKSQGENAKDIWDDLHPGPSSVGGEDTVGSSLGPSLVPSEELERLIIQRELKRKNKGKPTAAVAAEPEHLQRMRLKRKEMVEKWAQQNDGGMNDQEVSNLPEEQARLVRITADQIVSEVVNLALTHMLLEAEAGKNTHKIMKALKQIQTDSVVGQEHDVTLWKPNLPRLKTAKGGHKTVGVSFAPPVPPQKNSNKKKSVAQTVTLVDNKEEIINKTEQILTSAIKKRQSAPAAESQSDLSPLIHSPAPAEILAHHHHHHHNDGNDQIPHKGDLGQSPSELLVHHHHHHHEDGHQHHRHADGEMTPL